MKNVQGPDPTGEREQVYEYLEQLAEDRELNERGRGVSGLVRQMNYVENHFLSAVAEKHGALIKKVLGRNRWKELIEEQEARMAMKVAGSNHRDFDNKKDAIDFLKKNALMSVGWTKGKEQKVAIYWNGRIRIENAKTKKMWGTMDNTRIARELVVIAHELTAAPVRLKDGMGRRVAPSPAGVKKALQGPTSMVETHDSRVVILYDENNEEWDLDIDDGMETDKFHDERNAIRGFFEAIEDLPE